MPTAASVTMDTPRSVGYSFSGPNKVRRGTLNLGDPYAASGIAFTPANFNLRRIDKLVVQPSAGYVFEWVKSSGKVKAYLNKDPAAAGGADLALPEVGAVSLVAVNARFEAVGV